MSEESKEKTYSQAFETFERLRSLDPVSKMYFAILDELSPDLKEDQAETGRKLMSAVDYLKMCLEEANKTPEGKEALEREVKKRVKNNV